MISSVEKDYPEGRSAVLKARFGRKATPDDTARMDAILIRAIERAKQGDADAVRYLYVRYADNVYGYARSILRNDHDAEDVTQQVFTKLITAIVRYEPRAVPFSGWILRVAHNLSIDHLRRRHALPCAEVRHGETPDSAEDRNRYRARSLLEALGELPKEQREVLVLRHIVGLSPAEIAVRVGKSEGAVHGLQHRGRGRLRAALIELQLAPATN